MPVPAPNFYPDFNTIRLSHVCLNVADLNDSLEPKSICMGGIDPADGK